LPHIVANGADWFKQWGTEKSPGTKVVSVSGHVNRPANYEIPLGMLFGDLLDLAGGMRDGRPLKAIIPGGASAPLITSLDVPVDFEGLKEAGSMLGSGAVVFMDDTTCMVRNALVTTDFFEHESCGKCTPCREGTWWAVKVLERVEYGQGRQEDMDLLLDIANGIDGRSFCPLGDAASWALRSNVKEFRAEFEQHVSMGACPFEGDHQEFAGIRSREIGAGEAGVMDQPAAAVPVDGDDSG
jgi:NADH-quinone oxidoreductase subunit F